MTKGDQTVVAKMTEKPAKKVAVAKKIKNPAVAKPLVEKKAEKPMI